MDSPNECDIQIWDMTSHILKDLLKNVPAVLYSSLGVSIASVILEINGKKQIVAIGTGNSCLSQNQQSTLQHNLIFDSHSVTIVRRALKVFLFEEVHKFHNEQLSENCIFTKSKKHDLLHLKENVKFHIFMSRSPDILLVKKTGLHVYSEGGDTFMSTSVAKKYMMICKNRNVVMTDDSKLLQWSVIGWQGALLSHFIAPIYMSSCTVGYHSKRHVPNISTCFAMADDSINQDLPEGFRYFEPETRKFLMKEYNDQIPFETRTLSVNWYDKQENVEIIEGSSGEISFCSPHKCISERSRLCKASLFQIFRNVAEKMGRFDLLQERTYRNSKIASSSYMQSKTLLHHYFSANGMGTWINRSEDIDKFT
uniref:adenosine deaminase domain-containing protein 1-like n=1 Tax=Styela clava TaxID=7725 RepID=UPI001939C021|nr:adenosine deaminase domain-containing protein 1-like [Styela clava]